MISVILSLCVFELSIPRLILIAEKKTVYEKFPIPLISRLEKHFVVTSSVFCEWQNDVLKNFEEWTKKMSQVDDHEK